MSNTGVVVLAIVIALVPLVIYMTIRYVANMLDEARRDASEAWKEVVAERTARARAEAEAMQLRARYARKIPLQALPAGMESATAPVSKDMLHAILRANGEPIQDFVATDEDEPTQP